MDNIIASASTIIAFVLAFTQLIKKYTGAESKWLPLINLGMGLALGVAWSVSFAPNELIFFVWGGAVAGLAAGGFYDLGSGILHRKDEE